ncbi:CLUMA_CG020805, isoform A [Clunio marinus]|uniref:CLUMA_CG020805, isoform A n=1 Tax=Clunio marinus TaxID=568069 RepID=A0A1J1J619_9DIPT|nr:CLUMA_CG020805, isoform A [Clunio marinus]
MVIDQQKKKENLKLAFISQHDFNAACLPATSPHYLDMSNNVQIVKCAMQKKTPHIYFFPIYAELYNDFINNDNYTLVKRKAHRVHTRKESGVSR